MPTSNPPDAQRPKPSPQALVLATLLQHAGNVHLDKLAENLGPEAKQRHLTRLKLPILT